MGPVQYHRKVIKITAEDSPNVKLALEQKRRGVKPTHEVLLEGVLTYQDYITRLATWDAIRKTIGLRAEFYEGAEVKLFPTLWLIDSEQRARELIGLQRRGKSMGIDTAEGGDSTCWAVGDELGLLDLISMKTKNTAVITGHTIALGNKWAVPPENWVFDRGGGGLEHADRLREERDANGNVLYPCRTVGFGEAISMEPRRGTTRLEEKREHKEERYAYKNRRAELYGDLRWLLDPSTMTNSRRQYAIPTGTQPLDELRRQLTLFPLLYDGEGRMYLPPKTKPHKSYKGVTLDQIMGCSPDESDALVLMIHGMLHKQRVVVAGGVTT